MTPKIQSQFFNILKNCHREDPPWKVLTWICELINAEVVRIKDEVIDPDDTYHTYKGFYEIWKMVKYYLCIFSQKSGK